MLIGVLAILAICVFAVAIIGVVVVGKDRRLAQRMPHFADRSAVIRQHLDGRAEPPAQVVEAVADAAELASQTMHKVAERVPVPTSH